MKTPPKNKFLSLLVFLGLLFLISVLKDLFSTQSTSVNIVPVRNSDSKYGLLSTEEQTELVDKGKRLLSEMEDDSLMGEPLVRKAVLEKVEQLNMKKGQVKLPKKLL